MATKLEDAEFTIIRVTTGGPMTDGKRTKNKYTIYVEVPYGLFTAVVPWDTNRLKLSYPLRMHPAVKVLEKKLSEAMKQLEAEGKIGGAPRAELELAKPLPGTWERTEKTSEFMRELQARKAAAKP